MARFLSIEAESTQIRVGEVEISGRKGRMLQCFCVPVPQGSVEDGQIRDTKGLGELLRQQLNERGIRTKKAWFVTGSTRIASREVQIPLVKKSRIQSIIEANATDYFPIDVTKYVMSYIILGITGEKGKKGEEAEQKKVTDQERQYRLMVYASPKAISTAYYEFAQSAGLTLSGITFTGNTVYQTVQEEYTSGAHILIKVELENTGISIIRDGKLSFQRNINYGMESAVETIRSFPQFGDRLEVQDALQLLSEKKWIYPSLDGEIGEEPDTVKSEVTESLRYLVGNISRIMDYYISRNGDVNFESIVLCGMGGQVQGLTELLTQELGQKVELLTKIVRYSVPETNKNGGIFLYIAVMDPVKSGLNLMEKVGRKKKETKETLSGAIVVFVVGAVAGVLLTAAGFANRIYQQRVQNRLNMRITEESSIEDIYNAYNAAKVKYENYENMYKYTNTPNEGLKDFIEEMEQKMPSDITIDNFNSTGSQVSFSMRVTSKSAAANTLMQLRTFDSLATVTTTGIDQGEDGTVSMSVACTYADPAPLDTSAE